MLEISLQGVTLTSQLSKSTPPFCPKKRQSYLDLPEILEECAWENLILTDEEYSNMNQQKMVKYRLSIINLAHTHQEILD